MTADDQKALDEWAEVADTAAAISKFLAWVESERDIRLGEYGGRTSMLPVTRSRDSLILEYLGIDDQRMERVRRELLAELRETHS